MSNNRTPANVLHNYLDNLRAGSAALPLDVSEYPHWLREGLAAFELFRRLGIEHDDIFFVAATDEEAEVPAAFLVVRRRDQDLYVLTLGPTGDLTYNQTIGLWKAACARTSLCPAEDALQGNFYGSNTYAALDTIMEGLVDAGVLTTE
jgi:hypothetical protein